MGVSSMGSRQVEESELLIQRGDVAAALRAANQALEIAQASGEPNAVAAALVGLARVRFRLGQYHAAGELAHRALGRATADVPARVDALQVLGNCAAETRSLAEAESWYRQAAGLARELGYHRAHLAALHGLSVAVYLPRGLFDLALDAAQEALRIARERDLEHDALFCFITRAWAYRLLGQGPLAHAALDELSQLAEPGSLGQGHYLWLSADQALDEGEIETALALYSRLRPLAEATGEPTLNVVQRLGMSRAYRLRGDGPAAHAWAGDALAVATRFGYRHWQGVAHIERGRSAWLCDNLAAAEADLRSAAAILEELGAAFDLARAQLLLAVLLRSLGSPLARAALQDAVRSILDGGYAFLLDQERALALPWLAAGIDDADASLARQCTALLEQLQRVPAPPLQVTALGRLRLRQGRRHVQPQALRQRRAGELFVLLLLSADCTLTFEQVADALWPNKRPAAAQTAFHHATSTLRRILEPDLPDRFPSRYLELREGDIRLSLPPGSSVDWWAFEDLCRRSQWEAALALYGGELLSDSRYAEWLTLPRRRLALLYERALLAAAQKRLIEGHFSDALDACQRLLEEDPWQEQAVLLGMRACLGLDDRIGALRLYETLRKTLHDELGAEPQGELQALARSLTG